MILMIWVMVEICVLADAWIKVEWLIVVVRIDSVHVIQMFKQMRKKFLLKTFGLRKRNNFSMAYIFHFDNLPYSGLGSPIDTRGTKVVGRMMRRGTMM